MTYANALVRLIFAVAVLSGASERAWSQCLTASTNWQNNSLTAQGAAFGASFDAIPGMNKMDGITGLSNGPASSFSSLAIIVRFNNTGFIDARNGGAYAASASVPYTAGSKYHVRLAVDPLG